MRPLTDDERALAADVNQLLGDLPGFGGVRVREQRGMPQLLARFEEDRLRVRALGRLTALPKAGEVLVVSRASHPDLTGEDVCLTDAERAAAVERDERRRETKSAYETVAEVTVSPSRRAKAVLVVAAAAPEIARQLRSVSMGPLTTYAVRTAEGAFDALLVHPPADLVVLERRLPRAAELERHLRECYPLQYAKPESVQWLGEGAPPAGDADRILSALGPRFRATTPNDAPFARLRVVVVPGTDDGLAEEVSAALPGAEVLSMSWVAARGAREDIDLVVAGDLDARTAPHLDFLVRIVESSCALVFVATSDSSGQCMVNGMELTRSFVERPLQRSDLLRAF